MELSNLVEEFGRELGPYVDRGPHLPAFVNHLPMGQFALWQMSADLERIRSFSEHYLHNNDIKEIDKGILPASSLEACLGKPARYEACLALIRWRLHSEDLQDVIRDVLNRFPLGLSSGLFHVTIRLAYSWEGWQEDESFVHEAARALAYYVTAQKQMPAYDRLVDSQGISEEMQELRSDSYISSLVKEQSTTGQKLKVLSEDGTVQGKGFRLQGTTGEKASSLIFFLMQALNATPNIVVLHCLTGLHGFLVLEEFFDDSAKSLDLLTAGIINHLLTVPNLAWQRVAPSDEPWPSVWQRASDSLDVHTIKLAYSCHQLEQKFGLDGLKSVAIQRLEQDN